MTIPGVVRTAAILTLVAGLAACAERPGGTAGPSEPSSAPSADLPDDAGALVLQVGHTGGFLTPDMLAARIPSISVYADGRVITDGPVPAIYPGPALPNVQVQQIGPDEVQVLADRALAAGVGETSDLGMPPIADAPATRFTLVTGSGTHVREVYALAESRDLGGGPSQSGLTAEQEAARAELSAFLDELWELGQRTGEDGGLEVESYVPEAIAAVATPWVDPEDGLDHPERPWPGPALPGEPMSGGFELGCVVASGDQARAVLAAAAEANAATPWASEGARWSVRFRPLLPHESGCADLGDN